MRRVDYGDLFHIAGIKADIGLALHYLNDNRQISNDEMREVLGDVLIKIDDFENDLVGAALNELKQEKQNRLNAATLASTR
ncbi:hypothetical protein [Paenibacillus sp. IHBB 3054]|uniref:hypothetical protein n=1 Tax=Paenibacillus sp. IHBB 3054 TaxID=3425689 RepID=UPI003F67A0C5